MFCEKCGSLLIPKEKKGKKLFYCRKCKTYYNLSGRLVEKSAQKSKITLIGEKRPTLPTVEEECPKCGHKKAYFWIEQTRASDEPPTRFYKCKKCGHVWREYH